MTKRLLGILCCGLVCLLAGCKGDITDAGSGVLDEGDAIVVKADTFSLNSGIIECRHIISSPDSFLLGEIETKYGVLRADVLTQLACPVGYQYPDNAVIDSVCMFFYYRSWEGDDNSPMSVDVYEIDRKELEYTPAKPYKTDLDISDYCSLEDSTSLLYNDRLVVAKEMIDSVYNSSTGTYLPMVRCRLKDSFTQRFAKMRQYSDQDEFNRFFKGLYITSTFGSSTILNLSDISMGVYYHFSYEKAGKDTTVNDVKGFYANSEVRQLNRFDYLNRKEVIEELQKDSNTYNYIVAPAGLYTRMDFPMKQMKDVISKNLIYKEQQKREYVNLAELRVEVLNVFTGSSSDITPEDWLQPASYMLLIKESSMERFFQQKELPSDTVAILSALTSGVDSEGNTIYYYTYDMSTLLTNQLRQTDNPDTLQMLLVPVSVETSGTSSSATITAVKQAQTLSATQVRSAQNAEKPMTMKVVYSGF